MSGENSDADVPSVARMFEFWLGGSHFKPIDAERAGAFETLFPPAPGAYAMLRECTQIAARRMHTEAIRSFLVLGAGVPASGNVHEFVQDSRVLYTDIDPAALAIGKTLVADLPLVGYDFADAGDPLGSDAVSTFLKSQTEPVGVLFTGVTPFVPDDALKRSVGDLFHASPAGSALFMDFDGPAFADYPDAVEAIKRHTPDYSWRARSRCSDLFAPWTITEPGVVGAAQWTDAGSVDHSASTLTYAGYATKP